VHIWRCTDTGPDYGAVAPHPIVVYSTFAPEWAVGAEPVPAETGVVTAGVAGVADVAGVACVVGRAGVVGATVATGRTEVVDTGLVVGLTTAPLLTDTVPALVDTGRVAAVGVDVDVIATLTGAGRLADAIAVGCGIATGVGAY